MSRVKDTASERVIRRVANRVGRDALELPPLYNAIDPDALDALVDGMSDGDVSFVYAGIEVTIESDGSIDLVEVPSGDAANGVAWS